LKAVILAGGLGTRLRPLTLTRPKPLLPVGNAPLVARILQKLPRDVDEVVLAVNYKLDRLAEHFDAHDYGVRVTLVEEKEPLGTGGAIKNVESHIDGDFLVFNADILDSLDVGAFRATHARLRGAGAIALWRVPDPRHYGVVALDATGVITRFVEKPATREEAPSDLANAGTYVLTPEVFEYMRAGEAASIERDVFPAMIAGGLRLAGVPFEGYWVDCGRPETYLKANALWLEHAGRATLLGRDVTDRGATFEEWAAVGDGCVLGQGSTVARSVLLPGAVVGDNAVIRDSVLGEGARVGPDAGVVESVIGDGGVVAKGMLLRKVRVDPMTEAGDDG